MAKRRWKRNADGHCIPPWVEEGPGPVRGTPRKYRCATCGVTITKIIPPERGAPLMIECRMPLTLGDPRAYCNGTMEIVDG